VGFEGPGTNLYRGLSGDCLWGRFGNDLLFGEYVKKVVSSKKKVVRKEYWEPKTKTGPLNDPYNRFVHFVLSLENPKNKKISHLAFCDSRKFGKVTIFHKDKKKEYFKNIGPEPLEESFAFIEFKKVLFKKPNGKIKEVLLNQEIIAGIGNIYSDEMLWLANISPKSILGNIPDKELKSLFQAMKKVLEKGISFGGDSMSDYRNIYGQRGDFQNHHNVYRKTKEKCGLKNCKGVIIKSIIGGRSSHYCNVHQKEY